jgi:hypothetical protein
MERRRRRRRRRRKNNLNEILTIFYSLYPRTKLAYLLNCNL